MTCLSHHYIFTCKVIERPNVFYYPRVFRRKKGDYVLPFAVRPSVRPSGNSLPASPPTLLMLESPNLYA